MLSVGGVRGGEMVCVGYDVVSWSISPLSVSDSIYQCPPPRPLIADLSFGPNRSKRVVSWGRTIYRVTWKVGSGKSLICSSLDHSATRRWMGSRVLRVWVGGGEGVDSQKQAGPTESFSDLWTV